MRKWFFGWLFRKTVVHHHGPGASRLDRIKCILMDWSAGMPLRLAIGRKGR